MSVEKNNVDWSIKKTFVNLNVLFVTFIYAYFLLFGATDCLNCM